ncbi:sensor domain-containing protein [Quatrionicoccus australiensis]|uniref:sensor domain-containing protein n=1 Tax=Quatrionicoccus australiensis TaxID=138118 RepID=UPI001CFA0729|nr:bifunctional diguanylate cyclase/phosphodiesterase [Quatrionicoccus australiensis]MCB4359906.1 EAL domain-containing protein [Quatrionicoccus australiensis]
MADRIPSGACVLTELEVAPGKTLPELCEIQHAILENAGRAIIATDTTGTVIYFNPVARHMLGYAWSEVVGQQVASIFHLEAEIESRARLLSFELERDVRPDFEVFVARLADNQAAHEEWTYVRKDGSQFPVELTVSALKDSRGRLIGYLGIASDISWRTRLEQDMQIAALAFKSQAAIMVTDAERRILRVNPAFTTLTGYSAEESMGRTPAMLKSGRHDAMFYRQMWDSLNANGHWQGEVWNRRKSGGIFPEWLTISEVRDDRGMLTHYVSTFSDISDLKLAESEIHNLAFFDPLTALPNRRLLLNRLGLARVAGKRSQQFGALLIIDLDHFKNLNDTLGHDVGDRLLVEVARRLRACIREGDTAARQGGDEFIVMLEDLGSEAEIASIQAEAVAEKIRLSLNEPFLVCPDIQHFHSASIGVSLFCGHDKTTEALLKQADIALYKAKDAGRNSVRFFDSAMQTALDTRASLESRLRRALSRNEFVLYVQAQVNSARQLIGAETLLRWQPPDGAMIGPADFIPLAEETGLIVPIGTWVLDTACAQLRRWADNPATQRLYLSVNVSARQFRQPDFVDQVQAALTRHAVQPKLLKLELTESLLLDNVEGVVAKMQVLREIGVRFSLDDFGTGYASLSYLKRFPFEQLKVDRSFIRDIAVDPDDAAIVRAIIAMGNTLRLNVVAEGVESEAQHRYLVEHGCTCFQGYLFGRPIAFADFEESLAGYGQPLETPDNWMI